MNLEEHIQEIRRGLMNHLFNNEASVSQGIVLRILQALSWPTYDTRVVSPEYSVQGRRVDFALCHPASKPMVFIEVKQPGQSEGSERQLFEYAFFTGIPLAILTDGQEWNFFLPGEQGDYGDRRLYKLDIVERDIKECVEKFDRYLGYKAITSGAAIESAREDYRNVSRKRQMNATLPSAWSKLITEEDELLIELLADKVESMCGYKPDPDSVADFLKEIISKPIVQRDTRSIPVSVDVRINKQKKIQTEGLDLPVKQCYYQINGKKYDARNAVGVLVGVFQELAIRDRDFLQRFTSIPKHGRKRRYLSRVPDELYPGRPDLVASHSKEVQPGWWIGTNYSRNNINDIIILACEVSNLKYGRDVIVSLGN